MVVPCFDVTMIARFRKKCTVKFSFCPKSQGRSQYEANRGTCLSHLRFDPGSVLFKHSHHKDPE